MVPKPKTVPQTQTRLDGFFAQFRRQPGSPAKSSSSPKPSTSPKSNVSSRAVSHRDFLPLSPKKKLIKHVPSSKRPWTDDDESDDGIIPIPVRPRKSPRTSPQPGMRQPKATNPSIKHEQTSSSGSSPLKTHPPSPSLRSSIEPTAQLQPSRPPSTTLTRTRDVDAPDNPSLTSDSSRSALNGSFSSTRTGVSYTSQRVVKNGQEMVLNSDSDVSDDSLEDLDDILGPPKPPAKSSSPLTELSRTPTPPRDNSVGGTRRSTRNISSTPSVRPRQDLSQPSTKLRFNLDALVARTLTQNQRNTTLQETLAAIDELDRPEGNSARPEDNEKQLRSLLKGTGADDDNAERLMEAMHRTEALAHERKWSFFDYDRFHTRLCEVELDALDCGSHPAGVFLQDEEQLQEALVSGYFKHMAKACPLSQGLVHWLFQHAVYGSRADIRTACVQALSNDAYISTQEFYNCIRKELTNLGMRGEFSTWQQSPIAPDRPSIVALPGQEEAKQPALGQLLRVISFASNSAPSSVAAELAITVARMSMDNRITADVDRTILLSSILKNCLATLSQQEDERQLQVVLQNLYQQASNDDFRLCMLDSFSQSNSFTSSLRRHLAMAWFYEDQEILHSHSYPFTSNSVEASTRLLDFGRVADFIRTRSDVFRISRRTNWSVLKSKLDLLTIGIGAGDPPPSTDTLQNSERSISGMEEPKAATKAYNAEVDVLADVVKKMHALVVDRGTSHVSRTEAKDNLERLKAKLYYMVRTKPPAKKNIFDDNAERNIESYLKVTPVTEEVMPDKDTKEIEDATKEQLALKGSFMRKIRGKRAQKDIDMAMETARRAADSPALQSTIVSPSEYHDAVESPMDVNLRSEAEQEFHIAVESMST